MIKNVSVNASYILEQLLFNADSLSPLQIEKHLKELEILFLARTLKAKFPEDTRPLEDFIIIVKEELPRAKKQKTNPAN